MKEETLLELVARLDRRWQDCELKRQYHDDFQDEWPRLRESIVALMDVAAEARPLASYFSGMKAQRLRNALAALAKLRKEPWE